MGWSFPDISLDDLMKLIKPFIDMLILASGYQSNGRLAHWDSYNIKKAFQWALFLENMSKGLTSSDDYKDSVKELDAALSELTSNTCFPQGFAYLSWSTATLCRARDLLLEHLIQTLPLRESHLKAILTASVEMDFSELQRTADDCLHVSLEKQIQNPLNGSNLRHSKISLENYILSLVDAVPSKKNANLIDGYFSVPVVLELRRRQLAVSCLSAVENCLGILSKSIVSDDLGNTSCTEGIKHSTSLMAEELPLEPVVWNSWRSRNLSYMLDIRTTRLVSGANLIFSAPESQWIQMFERLHLSAESDDNLCETIELLLFGCIADKWNALIEHFMSISYEFYTISKLYHEVFNLALGKTQNLFMKEGLMNKKEKSVIDYLEVLLRNRVNLLWKLSPVIAAAAIPSWSQLFRSYLLELNGKFRGYSSFTRCCTCITDGVKHGACEVAERIWCLYIFHVYGSHATQGTNNVA